MAAFLVLTSAVGFSPACSTKPLVDHNMAKPAAYRTVSTADGDACCAQCDSDGAKCAAWVFTKKPDAKEPNCHLKPSIGATKPGYPGKLVGIKAAAPTPAPTPTPTPPPVPAGSQKNIIFVLTDDQDLQLGSMRAMPRTAELICAGGANLTNHFANTPICCPSRATMVSGRFSHNNRVSPPNAPGGCMHMNTSQAKNPDFWQDSFVPVLHDALGYTTGMFGKLLNSMDDYGCDGVSGVPRGFDRYFAMCDPKYYEQTWADDGRVYTTGSEPGNYTTSLIGNKTLAWLKDVVGRGPTHPPFFAFVAPHAPHLPSTPAPWYADHPIGKLTAPITPHYNYSGLDHHPLIANQPILNAADAAGINDEYASRMRSLLSVDDLVADVADYLRSVGELDNTYIFYSSDHGYSQGQFRVTSHKTQVYDHVTRVPMYVRGPGIAPGTALPQMTQHADLGPTFIELAGGTPPARMDGRSFASFLTRTASDGAAAAWRDTVVIEYWSIRNTLSAPPPELRPAAAAAAASLTAMQITPLLQKPNKHYHDGPNNTFIAVRTRNEQEDTLFAEFTDVTCDACWDFPASKVHFRELYNMSADPFMKHNMWDLASPARQQELTQRLQQHFVCSGSGTDAAACP